MLSIHQKLYFWVDFFPLNLYNFSCTNRKKVEQKNRRFYPRAIPLWRNPIPLERNRNIPGNKGDIDGNQPVRFRYRGILFLNLKKRKIHKNLTNLIYTAFLNQLHNLE